MTLKRGIVTFILALAMLAPALIAPVSAQEPTELFPEGEDTDIRWRRELYDRLDQHRRAVERSIAHRRILIAQTWNISRYASELDSQWQGATFASDGNLYFAVSSHAPRRGAVVFRYNPRSEEITQLCRDISTICGEDPSRQVPQGLMPTAAVEIDDTVFWGTHIGSSRPDDFLAYTGGYVVGYNFREDRWRNLGRPRNGYAVDAIAADNERGLLYFSISPLPHMMGLASYLYVAELPEGNLRNLGVLGYGGRYRGMWVDREGNCWVGGDGGALLRYSVNQDVITGYPNALPYIRTDMGFTDGNAANQARRSWNWVSRAPARNEAVFTMRDGVGLYKTDPRHMGGTWGSGFQWVTDIGHTGLGCVLSGDRMYYVQETAVIGEDFPLLHLKSIDYTGRTRRIEDYGVIRDRDGRVPVRIHSLAADDRDRIFIIGEWITREGDATIMDYDSAGRRVPWGTAIMLGMVRIDLR